MNFAWQYDVIFKDNVDVPVSSLAIKNVIDAEDIELENSDTIVLDMLNSKRHALTLSMVRNILQKINDSGIELPRSRAKLERMIHAQR